VIARNLTRGTVLGDRIDTADSLWAKFMGLMGRATLDAGAGLWLPDSNGIHMMFMRFPIDAVFLGRPQAATGGGDTNVGAVGSGAVGSGESGSAAAGSGVRRVVAVRRALPAWTGLVPFIRGAHGVLELPVGTIDESATALGDELLLE
jgi:uncharacterized membrane protein (UPF0127 family)